MLDARRTTTLVLDNEAVQALIGPTHQKHKTVLAHVEAIVARRARGATDSRVWVPTSVRVEAGWDRTATNAAAINRLRVQDHHLDGSNANRAATIRELAHVSVVDAHVGVAVQDADLLGHVVVLTSDPDDIRRASQPAQPVIIRI